MSKNTSYSKFAYFGNVMNVFDQSISLIIITILIGCLGLDTISNKLKYWILILLSIFIGIFCGFSIVVVFVSLFFIIEFLEFTFGNKIWNQTERTANAYDWFSIFLKNGYGKNVSVDLTESMFFENYTITIEKATINKYRYIFEQLRLSKGKYLLDCGCGIGSWMDYCRYRGVKVIGLTLSKEQAIIIKKKDMDVLVHDYRIPIQEFIGKFDAITLLGSTEHICTMHGVITHKAEKRCNTTYDKLFTLLKTYLKKNGLIYLTQLVYNPIKYDLNDYVQLYFMERHYGGYYIEYKDLHNSVEKAGLQVITMIDYTKDYHWTSIISPDHFGNWTVDWKEDTKRKVIFLLRNIITDPFWLHHWLYYYKGSWLWQFGGYKDKPLTDNDVQKATAQLKHILISSN